MKAIIQHTVGGPEVLELAEVERPTPIPSEVLVRVHAAGVNPIDVGVRSGQARFLGAPPFIVGWDVSGVVEEIVPGVTRFEVGDEVYGMPFFPRAASAYAEYVTAPSRHLARKPRNISHIQSAALPLAGLTAWQGLVDTARLEPGQRVLIHGGGGGVGHLAVQIAKALGAQVITTASAGKREFVAGLGADEIIDYHITDFTEVLRDLDVVFDTVGGDNGPRSIEVLRPGGMLVSTVGRNDFALRDRTLAAGRRFAGLTVEPDRVGLEAMTELAEAGKLIPHVEQVLPLNEAAKAHELLESRSGRGKIVLTL
ncbi:NADP-dependent oxidoreductase [Nocardia sp. NPDC088792]|uniref:NADP-dependent oxidoreductase n=1 Tax=Nocardia sp. NPDC088792 TaxID=3364332 RepID=UPI00381E9902